MNNRISILSNIISELVRRPSSIYRVLQSDIEDGKFGRDYVKQRYQIESLPAVSIESLVGQLEETIPYYSYLPGTSLTIDIALLMALARRFESCTYLEIGSWRGESLAAVASIAKHCFSITLGKKEMAEIGLSEDQIALHGHYTKHLKNIAEIHADSTRFDFDGMKERIDLVFIDGSHKKEDIQSDTKNAFRLLRNDQSIIVWHDYGWDTERVRYNTLAGIFDGLPSEKEKKHLYHVAQTKCAIYWPFEVRSFPLKRHGLPKQDFSITVRSQNK